MIVRKLEYFRESRFEKHLRDIRSILSVSKQQLDEAAVRHWIDHFGLQREWQEVIAALGPDPL